MAKLSSIANTTPIALSVPGVFVRNVPAKVIDDKFGNIAADLEKDQEAVIVSLFTDLLCDEDGAAFEGCGTFDEIAEVLSIGDIHAIMAAIPVALAPNEDAAEK
tara:strand:+ start:881 stop:1192 length:312 start_codon:yes stop_codon:yes gene_type:complete